MTAAPATAGTADTGVWRNCPADRLDAGFSDSTFWIRLRDARPNPPAGAPATAEPERFILAFHWKTLGQVDLFVTDGRGRLREHLQAGDDRPRDAWPLITGDYPAFPVTPRPDRAYYFRIQSQSIKRFPIRLHTEESFQRRFDRESMVIWIFAGVIFTVALMSVLFSLGLGESVYVYYGLYTLSLWMNLNSIYGNAFRVFYPESPWLAHRIIFFTQGLALFFSILFFRKVTRLPLLQPRTDRIAFVFQVLALVLVPLTLLDIPRVFFSRIYSVTYLFAVPTFIFLMLRLVVYQGQRNLIAFATGWGIYYSLGIVHLTFLFGLVPYHPFPVFGMVLALPIETLVFGGGLFLRYRSILAEREKLAAEKTDILERLERLHNPRRYATSKLGGLDIPSLLVRLNHLLENERVYRNEELTLKDLAERLDVNPHQLSELLNAKLNVNFRQLLVNHRLQEAETLLVKAPEKTVLEIALAVGFNSKTAFNVAFKKAHGINPTQYRNRKSERANHGAGEAERT